MVVELMQPCAGSLYRAEQTADGEAQGKQYSQKQRLLVQVAH